MSGRLSLQAATLVRRRNRKGHWGYEVFYVDVVKRCEYGKERWNSAVKVHGACRKNFSSWWKKNLRVGGDSTLKVESKFERKEEIKFRC